MSEYEYPTIINASEGLPDLFSYVNNVTNSWFSNLLLVSIYLIMLVGFYKAKGDFSGAMAVAGFGTFIVSLLFWVGGLITGITFGFAIAMAIIGVIVLLLDNPM